MECQRSRRLDLKASTMSRSIVAETVRDIHCYLVSAGGQGGRGHDCGLNRQEGSAGIFEVGEDLQRSGGTIVGSFSIVHQAPVQPDLHPIYIRLALRGVAVGEGESERGARIGQDRAIGRGLNRDDRRGEILELLGILKAEKLHAAVPEMSQFLGAQPMVGKSIGGEDDNPNCPLVSYRVEGGSKSSSRLPSSLSSHRY